MTKHKILTPALVVALSFLSVYSIVWAASTVGTNLSTTGALTVTGTSTLSDVLIGTGASLSTAFEVTTYASISGNLLFGGSGTHTLGVSSGSGALTINAFTLGGAFTGGSQNITGLALLTVTNASASATFEASTLKADTISNSTGTLTINAFTLGGAVTGSLTGVSNISSVNASASLNIEAIGYASASNLFAKTNIVVGGAAASSSSIYAAELMSTGTTASTSILMAPSSATTAKGTCLQLKDTLGNWVYARVLGGTTSFTISTVKCHN